MPESPGDKIKVLPLAPLQVVVAVARRAKKKEKKYPALPPALDGNSNRMLVISDREDEKNLFHLR